MKTKSQIETEVRINKSKAQKIIVIAKEKYTKSAGMCE